MGSIFSKDAPIPTGDMPMKQIKLCENAWRKLTITWDDQKRSDLLKELRSYKPDSRHTVSTAQIIMTGPVSAGKSSLVNTLQSALNGHIVTGKAMAGNAAESLTTIFRNYRMLSEARGTPLHFELMDTMGLARDNIGIQESTFEHIINGDIKVGFDFNGEDLPRQKLYITDGKGGSTDIHLVVIVLNAVVLDVIPEEVRDKLKGFQSQLALRNLPLVVVLTHIDQLCEHVENDTANVYQSQQVKDAVQTATAIVGVSANMVLPIRNYHSDAEADGSILRYDDD